MQHFNKPVAAICLAVASAFVQAQQATYDFDIPAQPAGQVLDALAKQTGLQPFYAEGAVKGAQSPGVKGRLSLREALDKALAGTGLTYQFTGEKAVAIKARQAGNTTELQPITVTSKNMTRQEAQLNTHSEAGSRLGLTARENPASVAIADREWIEQIGARNFQAAANSLPGVNASAPPGWSGHVAYRGFTGMQINQLFNGISLQSYSAGNRPVSSWIYDRVELVGGPSSFLNGSGAVSGSINYVSKLANRDGNTGEALVSYGRFDTSETSVGINRALADGHWARLDYSHNASNGYVDSQERKADALAVSLLSDLTPNLTHTLAIEFQNEDEKSPYWGLPTMQPQVGKLKIDESNRFDNYNVKNGSYQQQVGWLRSIADYKYSAVTSLRNTLYHYQSQRDYSNLEVYKFNAANTLVSRSGAYLQRHEQELTGDRVEVTHKSTLFGLGSDWVFGFDFNVNRHTQYPTFAGAVFDAVTPGAFDPGYFEGIPGMNNGLQRGRSTHVKTLSMFVENRLRLSDRLALLAALRHDHIDFHLDNAPGASPATFDRQWNAVTGRLGAVYDVTKDASLYAQYSTSAEPPGGTLTGATVGQIQDFDLSTGRQYEMGSKLNFLDGRGSASLAAYHIVRRNFPVTDPNNVGSTIQAGQQTSKGIELAASLQATPRLRIDGNYAWVDAVYDEFNEASGGSVVSRKGKTPVNVPKQVANLWLTYDVGHGWETGMGARHVSSVYADNANTMWAPSYTLFDAFVKYKLRKDVELTARLRNLTDEVYARFIHQRNTQYYLGEPRNLEVTLQARF